MTTPVYQEFKEYYDNGMVKLKPRIEEEFWYTDYQTVIELIVRNDFESLGAYINVARSVIQSYREIPPQMEYAIHLWCVLHWERKKHSV